MVEFMNVTINFMTISLFIYYIENEFVVANLENAKKAIYYTHFFEIVE